MEVVSFFLPAVYVAALVWALCGDFMRAQQFKDLEEDPPAPLRSVLHTASLPTLCLVGALLLRLLVHVRGLLLTALVIAVALSVWKMYRLSLLRAASPTGSVLLGPGSRRILPR